MVVAAAIEGSGSGYLVALQPVREINAAQRGVLGLLGVSALIATGIAWLAGGVVARRLTGRLLRLEEAAEDIAAGDWGRQVAEEGEDEIASLAHSFNRMSTRVSDAYRAQKEFVGDVSHELRTPITTVAGFAGALLDGVVTEPEDKERFLRGIRDEAGRLAELTQTLLALADMDAGRVELDVVEVDVSCLAQALSSRHAPVAVSRGVELTVDLSACEGVGPLGDEARVLQIASALLTNALAYTPAGGTVSVSSACAAEGWRLLVDDSGPGVPVAERERIFDRFVRLDRSRSAETGGSGLGLSICARLVDLMCGTIVVSDSPLGGARFTVTLPSRA